ncbi:MAG: vitamin K epoxide reductase family protein [Desulfobulbus sp.]|nr:vitamin K epoxide reductase family protein [Desulfobulbus sp.]
MLRKKNRALQSGQFLALAASLLVAGQIGFVLYQGTPFCLNDGCTIVEKLIKVPPLVFNGVGFCFFQAIYWSLRAARNERRRLPAFVPYLLLAALGVEAVLTCFQYLVAQTFCAYCLTILAVIVLLNCLLGTRQIMAGVLVFATTSLAFASLDLHQPAVGRQAFTAGVFASRPGVTNYPEHYLFFASTCPHCEQVIAALKTSGRLTVHFNPIDRVRAIDLDNTTVNTSYTPALNKALLAALGINEIPVLMTKTPDGWNIRQGEAAVFAALSLPAPTATTGGQRSNSLAPPAMQSVIPGMDSNDSCQVSSPDCAARPGQSTIR